MSGALGLVVVTGIKLLLYDAIGPGTPFLLYFGAVVAAAWYGGWPAGVLTTLGAAVVAAAVFMANPTGMVSLEQSAVFCLECVVLTWLTASMQRAGHRARASARTAQDALTRLEVVMHGVDEGITVQDAAGTLVFANELAARTVGVATAAEMLATPPGDILREFDLFDAGGQTLPLERLPGRALFAGGEPSETLVRFVRRGTSEERWSMVRAAPVRDAGGQLVYAINLFRDVTERRRQDEALRVGEQWLATTLRSIGDAVIATSADGRIAFLNPTAEQLTGWSSDDAAGRPLREVFQIFSEETRDPVEAPVERVLRDGQVVGLANHTILRSRDGRELAIDDSAAPIRDSRGVIIGVVLVFRDVSAARRAEDRRAFVARATELLASSLDYDRTLATVADAAVPDFADWCSVDLVVDGRPQRIAVAHVDPRRRELVLELERRYPPDPDAQTGVAQILRTGRSEWMPAIPRELLLSAARDAEHLALIDALELGSYIGVPIRRGDAVIGAITFAMAESHRCYEAQDLATAEALADRAAVAIENARLYREADALRHEAAAQRDRLEDAHRQAQKANRAKDEFLAILGHELRNPLAPIVLALELLEMRGAEVLERTRATIDRQTRHMVRLVDDLLDVSRIARGKVELQREIVAIADVIAGAFEQLGPALERGEPAVQVAIAPELTTRGDPLRLAQVVVNLLGNAIKYTPRTGRIEIDGFRDDSQVVLVVRDTGIGIDPEMLPHVFELFVQERKALDRAGGGLGLGLAIVQGLVEQHGGTVVARSEGAGHGTEFEVRLPAIDAPARAEPAPTPPDQATTPTRVLLVDDNADALELLALALEAQGHAVSLAFDAPTALAIIRETQPTIAMLDIGLPGMDGYQLAHQLREGSETRSIKLIAITGYGQPADRERALSAGFDEHLIKPVSVAAVAEAIAKLQRT